MSGASYCRVKWIIKAGELKQDEVEGWTGKVESDLIEVKLDDNLSINWTLVVSATASAISPFISFTLERRTLTLEALDVMIIAQSDNNKNGYEMENGPWGNAWKISKEEFANMLLASADKAVTFNIVFSVRKRPNICQSDADVQMLKENFTKTNLLFMVHHKDLTPEEKNFLIVNDIALPLGLEPLVREVTLVEYESDDDEDDHKREIKEDLICAGEFHSDDDDFEDFEDDMEIF